MITVHHSINRLHWNYFIALERDLEAMSRYIEFAEQNFKVYSIELAHLLFAAASEVDVVSKLLCKQFEPQSDPHNINDYKTILMRNWPPLGKVHVQIPRFGLQFAPWDNWDDPLKGNPNWWKSYNNVKHQRDTHFNEATLQHVLNALGGLYIFTNLLFRLERRKSPNDLINLQSAIREMTPPPSLFAIF